MFPIFFAILLAIHIFNSFGVVHPGWYTIQRYYRTKVLLTKVTIYYSYKGIRLGKLDCVSIVRNSLAFAVIFGMKR